MDPILVFAIKYVIKAPFFWQSMAATTSTAMIIGVILYDGHIEQAKKGIVSIGSYATLILWVTILRVNDRIASSPNFSKLSPLNASMAYAGIITIALISFFWLIGVIFGVLVSSMATKRLHKKSLDKPI